MIIDRDLLCFNKMIILRKIDPGRCWGKSRSRFCFEYRYLHSTGKGGPNHEKKDQEKHKKNRHQRQKKTIAVVSTVFSIHSIIICERKGKNQ